MKPYYEENGIVIYHGDCREILPSLPKVDLVLTDPPYLDGDLSDMLDVLLVLTARIVVTPGKQESFSWIRRKAPVWEYAWKCSGTSSLGGSACLHILFEPILAYGFPKRPLGSDLLDFPLVVDPAASGHPWPKPMRLFSKLLSHFSDPDETVVDPFMGSGTTLRAAKDLGRKAIGIEIEEKYCEIAANRLRQEVLQFA
jgi:hypothetical protein